MSACPKAGNKILTNNARFVAYLEQHRIYELFHEVATQLVIKRPEDHVAFIKQYLDIAARKCEVPRLILIAPPYFDKMSLAKVLQEELGVRPVTLKELRNAYSMDENICRCEESEDLALTMKKWLESGFLHNSGWLLVDLPRTKKEAVSFQRIGILPTHVIQLVTPNDYEDSKNAGAPELPDNFKFFSKASENRRYLHNLRGLREAYASYLIEIEVGIRSIEELGKDCAKLTKTRKHLGAPSLFRIALIGSRGSGCTTLAKYIAERFNLVHVDYDYIGEQARMQKTPLGETLRLFEHKWGERPKPEIRIQIVEKYISRYDCLRRGWILTGYPKTIEDFRLLDMISTSPNRVIFMEVSSDICRERLVHRRFNAATGSQHNLASKTYSSKDDCDLAIHPNDYKIIVERDLQEYEENVAYMMEYAGDSAMKIDGNANEKTVRERMEACLMRPTPSTKPRIPKSPEIDVKDVEFEPDDEVDCKNIDKICPTEVKYTFI